MGDRYTITERVDQGGMAEVFRGVAESIQGFKKNVAIKRILPSLTKNKKFVSMFLDEARLSLHLQHANIVHVFDIGMGADTAYFIVMEYVDGCNLKAVIDYHRKTGRRFKIAQVLYLMIEVCKGLAYAHDYQDPETGKSLGIVHRDISPPNILISRMGEVKLVDFGLAKATSQLEATDPGVVKGKFSYLSPEAASGQEVDARADIFAVGILLWEMLTGRRLFYGDTDYQTVELVRQAKVPAIAPLNPDVKPELEEVVRKALARDPSDRYQHAADVHDALAQYLFSNGLKVTSRDIATLVREVVADRDRSKPQAGGSKSLIDVLIQDEIAKFTSLDAAALEAQGGAPGAGANPLSPDDVGSGQAPLDPGSFIDTRGWVSDFDASGSRGHPPPSPTAAGPSAFAAPPAPPPLTPGAMGMNNPGPPAGVPRRTGQAPVGSLQQMLEPDKTGPIRSMPDGDAAGKRVPVGLLVGIVLVVLAGGGFLVYSIIDDKGDKPAPARTE